jgi:hypothetical protein
MVATLADEIALGVIEKALAGEVHGAREVADRSEGKAGTAQDRGYRGWSGEDRSRLGEERSSWRGRRRGAARRSRLIRRLRFISCPLISLLTLSD